MTVTTTDRIAATSVVHAEGVRTVLLGVLLVMMTLVAYQPALDGGFIWDDDNYVTDNPTLLDLQGLRRIWVEPASVPQYYPLTFTTFWVEYQLWGLDPFGYHLVNVLLHALNALLVWQLLRVLRVPGAWLAGAVFAVHPMHVESVAWITERKNVLSGACYLGAALAYLRFALAPAASRRWGWYAAALVLFAAALLSKTVTSTLPAALALVLWWKRGRLEWRDAALLAPFFVLGLAGAATTVWLERHHVGAQGAEWSFSAVEHILIAARIVWFYVWTLLWPSNLTFIYPRWEIDAAVWWQYLFVVAALAVAGLLFWLRHRIGVGVTVGLLLYVGTLVPALGLFNVYPMRYAFVADHFAYLASLGVIAVVAALAVGYAARTRMTSGTRGALVAGLLIGLVALSWNQAGIYRDVETLWSDTVQKNPGGWAPRLNYGGVLADRGRLDEALVQFETGVRMWPDSPEGHNALGAMYDQQGRFAEAAAEFEKALALEPRYYEAHTNLGLVRASQGRLIEAVDHLTIAVRLKPQYVDAYYHLATTLVLLNHPAEASRFFATTLLLAPEHAQAHSGLCALQIDEGRADDAIRHCRYALSLKPKFPEAHEHLARALRLQGRDDEARTHDEAALRLRQEMAGMHRRAGMALAEEGRPKAAIAQLREALRLLPTDADAQQALAELQQRP